MNAVKQSGTTAQVISHNRLKINVGPLILPYILNTILWDYELVWPDVWPENKCRSLWPINHGALILPYILKTFWYMNTILKDCELIWSNIRPQNKCRSLWSIFHGPVILPYILKTMWYMNTILLDYESVWPNVWPKNKCMSLWSIFHCPVILPYILKTIQWLNIVVWDYESVWSDIYIYVTVTVMVQWFCLISLRLFDVWTLYFVIMSRCTAAFALKQCRSQWSIFSWSSDFALYLK